MNVTEKRFLIKSSNNDKSIKLHVINVHGIFSHNRFSDCGSVSVHEIKKKNWWKDNNGQKIMSNVPLNVYLKL